MINEIGVICKQYYLFYGVIFEYTVILLYCCIPWAVSKHYLHAKHWLHWLHWLQSRFKPFA